MWNQSRLRPRRGCWPASTSFLLPYRLRPRTQVAAYSTQSDKVINSGEGGFVVTSDDAIAAKAIYLSGAYERRYGKKGSSSLWYAIW